MQTTDFQDRPTVLVPTQGCDGCLLQIHPLELDGAMRRIVRSPFFIGRESTCDLALRDTSISRRHARIDRTPVGYMITDLDSTNGVFINEQEVRTSLLSPGDCLRLGNRIFKFLSSDHIELQYHEAVYAMMTRDSLTGVWNKRYLLDALDRESKRAQRCRTTFCLALFDIDNFKQVNDTHGHLVGDEMLADLTKRISAALHGDDILARFGGDEFAILFSSTSSAEAVAAAERCRLSVADRPCETAAGPLSYSISLGLTCIDGASGASPLQIIELADTRLYKAKRAGRNRVCADPDL